MKYLELHLQALLYSIIWGMLLMHWCVTGSLNEGYYVVLYQMFGMMFFGAWQLISTIIRSIKVPLPSKKLFITNLWIAVSLLTLFAGCIGVFSSQWFEDRQDAYSTNFIFVSILLYSLLVNIAAIRYWFVLKQYYADTLRNTNLPQ